MDDEVRQLLEAIYERYHYDFRHYAAASLRRRLNHALVRLDCPSLPELRERLLTEETLFSTLLQYLTIQVSDMFRDPAFFSTFRQQVVPVLKTYPSLRLWIAGCSTGEEVYSFAIVLHEEGLLERTICYATDINGESLRLASAGVFGLDRMARFSTNYLQAGGKTSLSDYYVANYNRATFDRALRKNVVFSDHSLVTDSVFAEMQFISCRNVLIYFDRELQERVISLFRDALCRKGFLGLGAKESLRTVSIGSAFSEFAPDVRIYQKY